MHAHIQHKGTIRHTHTCTDIDLTICQGIISLVRHDLTPYMICAQVSKECMRKTVFNLTPCSLARRFWLTVFTYSQIFLFGLYLYLSCMQHTRAHTQQYIHRHP